jgi:hypothetical protein
VRRLGEETGRGDWARRLGEETGPGDHYDKMTRFLLEIKAYRITKKTENSSSLTCCQFTAFFAKIRHDW